MKKFNYSNLKNKTWDIKIINYLTQIHEEKGKQQLFLKQKTEELEKICAQISLPIIVIGGINQQTIPAFHSLPIQGFAVISAILSKKDIKKASQELLGLIDQTIGR